MNTTPNTVGGEEIQANIKYAPLFEENYFCILFVCYFVYFSAENKFIEKYDFLKKRLRFLKSFLVPKKVDLLHEKVKNSTDRFISCSLSLVKKC